MKRPPYEDRRKEIYSDCRHIAGYAELNDVFDGVYVINLKRQPNRLSRFQRQAKRHGLHVDVFQAVDGKDPSIEADYRKYANSRTRKPRRSRISYTNEFYLDPKFSERDRVAFLEKEGKPAIASSGAWAYMETYIAILKKAIADGSRRIMVFDDDALFHNNFNFEFSRAYAEVPAGWKVFLLGSMQFRWDSSWVKTRSPHLYSCMGSSVASHAVGLDCSIFHELLDHCMRRDMPFDIGPLSFIQRKYADACFIVSPNIVIQECSESEINTSSYLFDIALHENTFKWRLADFMVDGCGSTPLQAA